MSKEPSDEIKVTKEILCQDDFIEWILRNTNEDSEFRVYITKHSIQVGIDKEPFKEM